MRLRLLHSPIVKRLICVLLWDKSCSKGPFRSHPASMSPLAIALLNVQRL